LPLGVLPVPGTTTTRRRQAVGPAPSPAGLRRPL